MILLTKQLHFALQPHLKLHLHPFRKAGGPVALTTQEMVYPSTRQELQLGQHLGFMVITKALPP